MSERGRGNLKGAFGNVRRPGADGGEDERSRSRTRQGGRRRRTKTGKRSRPEEYAQANGLVHREVLGRWEQARADPGVRGTLEAELSQAGIEYKAGEPDFGAVCELLLGEWLQSVGYGSEEP